MMWAALAVVALGLVGIVWEDFRTQTIPLWLLLAVPAGLFGFRLLVEGLDGYWLGLFFNLALLGVNLGLAFLLLRLRGRAKVGPKGMIGMGDLVLLVGLAIAMPPVIFILTWLGGALFAIVGELIRRGGRVTANQRIPFAGWLSLFLLLLGGIQAAVGHRPLDSNTLLAFLSN